MSQTSLETIFRLEWQTWGQIRCSSANAPEQLIWPSSPEQVETSGIKYKLKFGTEGFLVPLQGQLLIRKPIALTSTRLLKDFLRNPGKDDRAHVCRLAGTYGFLHMLSVFEPEPPEPDDVSRRHLESIPEDAWETTDAPPELPVFPEISSVCFLEHVDYWLGELSLLRWADSVSSDLLGWGGEGLERIHRQFRRQCEQDDGRGPLIARLRAVGDNLSTDDYDEITLLLVDYSRLSALAPDAGVEAFRNELARLTRRRVDLLPSVSVASNGQIQLNFEVPDLRAGVWLQLSRVRATDFLECVQCGQRYRVESTRVHSDRKHCSKKCSMRAFRAAKAITKGTAADREVETTTPFPVGENLGKP